MTEETGGKAAPKGDRIAKLLARAGVASRREIERMIAEGRIALDGVALDTPATILTSLRGVTVDNEPVAPPEAARLYLYHKPTGLLVTERDPAGRPTIYDRLPDDLPRTVPVGRLDLNTEGLLLLTTDGGLKRLLELPATGVERTYRARTYGPVTQAMLEELIEGIEIDGIRYGPIDANLERRTGANQWIEMTLTEGKNREVRRVLEHLGLQVGRLIRTRYGPFILADLPPGEVGEVKQHDLVASTKSLAGPRRAKGADLDSLVTVESRTKPKPAAPAPRTEPDRPLRRAPALRPVAAATVSTGGWGSRTRPSRPATAADAPSPWTTRPRTDTAAPRDAARPATPAPQRPAPAPRAGYADRPDRGDRASSRFGTGDRADSRDGKPFGTGRSSTASRTGYPDRAERPAARFGKPAAGDRTTGAPRAGYTDRSDRGERAPARFGNPSTGDRTDRRDGKPSAAGRTSPTSRPGYPDRAERPAARFRKPAAGDRTTGAPRAGYTDRSDRGERAPARFGKPSTGDRTDRRDGKPSAAGRTSPTSRPGYADRADRATARFGKPPAGDRSTSAPRADRGERTGTPSAKGRTATDPRAGYTDRAERSDRSATPHPGKGPSGGRGRPARPTDGSPRRGGPGGGGTPGRGKR